MQGLELNGTNAVGQRVNLAKSLSGLLDSLCQILRLGGIAWNDDETGWIE
jgi:hypothetical protein